MILRRLLFHSGLLIISGDFALAQNDSLIKSRSQIVFSIDTIKFDFGQLKDTVDIIVSNTNQLIAGFDLKIGFNSYAFDILEVFPGAIPDSCKWEIFNAKNSIGSKGEGSPHSIWQIIGMAEFVPDTVRPLCYSIDRPASIARLVIELDSNRVRKMSSNFLPIYFYWEDCTDNTVTNVLGDSLLMSMSVDGISYSDSTGMAFKFPTRYGSPTSCISRKAKNKPVRKLAFVNGGVAIGEIIDNE